MKHKKKNISIPSIPTRSAVVAVPRLSKYIQSAKPCLVSITSMTFHVQQAYLTLNMCRHSTIGQRQQCFDMCSITLALRWRWIQTHVVVGIRLPPAAAVNANVNEYESGHDNLPSIGSANSHFPIERTEKKQNKNKLNECGPAYGGGDLRTNDFKDTKIKAQMWGKFNEKWIFTICEAVRVW